VVLDLQYSMTTCKLASSDGEQLPLGDFPWNVESPDTSNEFFAVMRGIPFTFVTMVSSSDRDLNDFGFYCWVKT